MPAYDIEIKASARKELEGLEARVLKRVFPKLEALADEPRPLRCKKLSNLKNLRRIRIGDYRVICATDEESKAVNIVRIAHRREVYD